MILEINKKNYKINNDEFKSYIHNEYNYLKLYHDIPFYERIIGLLSKCSKLKSNLHLVLFHTSHGGFIPIHLSAFFSTIFLLDIDSNHFDNISYNIEKYSITNCLYSYPNSSQSSIIFIENDSIDFTFFNEDSILICQSLLDNYDNHPFFTYKLSNSSYFIHVGINIHSLFIQTFHFYFRYFSDNITELLFDNLINVCIMVKNAGPQFEQMLIDNLPIIDNWTILDTGSTDETIDIIHKVLIGKKDGNLYQEPFINFRDSRNRLLDLAGESCKFIIMLDDTYIVKGNLRQFLNDVRSDQYSSSFSTFIVSSDNKYNSNRIIKSNSNLRYIHKIHEVITDKNNINILIPFHVSFIDDKRFDYMEKRTMDRKQFDIQLLLEELEENPQNPRTYYYLAQTYNLIQDYEKAFYYFIKRYQFSNSGFIQERIDAIFEAARLANFQLHKPWDYCEDLYMKSFKLDESRPESMYFIGIHYYLQNNIKTAYHYFKKAFQIGFPEHCQYSLRPTLSFHFLPKFLCRICYDLHDYHLGLEASELFINKNIFNSDDYSEILSWFQIYKKLTIYSGSKNVSVPSKPICCFVADGGFQAWSGSSILTTGVGGSETYIIEMAKFMKQTDFFGDVFVFCNTPYQKKEIFEDVIYRDINEYYEFINTNYVHTCIISRFSEYLPLTFKGYSENVYFVIHDLTPSGIVIPKDFKLKNIFCLSEWHVQYFTSIFPTLSSITIPFYYGIDEQLFPSIESNNEDKIKYKFIYSSFPNRGLLELLQMWPTLYEIQPLSTLHIYCDVDNKWSNEVEPEKMKKIKELLSFYYEKNIGIYYHGWVSKKELAEAWRTSSIWFYPCTFMETFCHTALEAAKSKTLVITNNLAALQNTVGNRGIIIEGDTTTLEWKNEAIQILKDILTSENNNFDYLINKNYRWSKNLTWKNQATKLFNNYLSKNYLEYKGMYNWTNDIPFNSKKIFLDIIHYFNSNKQRNHSTILEIGTYTGTSLIEIIKNIPNSIGYGLDKWSNYNENEMLKHIEDLQIEKSFYVNIEKENLQNRIFGIKSDSTCKLIEFLNNNNKFDFIYIDGSHLLLDCHYDLILSWQILQKNGIIAIDDYLFHKENILESPFEAVNHFLKKFEGQYKILHKDYRVFLEKII